MVDVSWHVEAIADVDAVGDYIAQNSPDFAPLFVGRILAAAERLSAFPESGRVVPEIGADSYREVIFHNYRIVYRLLREEIVIIGVVHGAMDLARQIERRGWEIP